MKPEAQFEHLENALVRAGRTIAYPTTPPVAERVRARLQAEPRPRSMWMWLPRPALTMLVALVVALVLLLAFPETREALAQLLGLRTVRIIPITPTPTLIVTPSSSPLAPPAAMPSPTVTGAPLSQCCATTLDDARTRAKFQILLPPSEMPSVVFLQDVPSFGSGAQQIILVFGEPNAPRLRLYQATRILYGKLISGGTVVEETQVKGKRALWLSGAPHLLVYLDANGRTQFGPERSVSANTLAWEIGDVTYRLETSLSKDEAIRFAESLR